MLGLLSDAASAGPDPFALTLGDAMLRWTATLDEKQRARARYAFDDKERFDLRLAPMGLEGLRIDEMSETQWQLLHTALGQVLSEEGLHKVDTIRSLEREVAELDNWFLGLVMGDFRDAKRQPALVARPRRPDNEQRDNGNAEPLLPAEPL